MHEYLFHEPYDVGANNVFYVSNSATHHVIKRIMLNRCQSHQELRLAELCTDALRLCCIPTCTYAYRHTVTRTECTPVTPPTPMYLLFAQ